MSPGRRLPMKEEAEEALEPTQGWPSRDWPHIVETCLLDPVDASSTEPPMGVLVGVMRITPPHPMEIPLIQIARAIFSPRTYSLVVEPQLSDHRLEYLEAIFKGSRLRARWIAARCVGLLAITIAAQAPHSIVQQFARLRRVLRI